MMSKAWPTTNTQGVSRGQAAAAALDTTVHTGVSAAVGRAVQRYRRWRMERQTIAALSGLDRTMLKDIGVDRAEIPAIARRLADQAW